ncbi:5-formyltetrahydrofolate cyclo-ligase [Buchnera aphidicola (Hyperomyzus lactucae)]|uniref:5-formyltetrahydrofolate cyclo-ligase n=1 Tax=Buchnera aphidicola (Hyperomyzus lactucae) TaxID=1241860 RepID=A0A4D6YA08_9GAMM|nr:5-formyltetrahydrofolate cyclo-ligase [Buchnera aphidicola]QCI21125.1 5-formyltetrahydrofolate cyclo-ligase [Buchnera aphidicola (Hyperomyzus lactucae)]
MLKKTLKKRENIRRDMRILRKSLTTLQRYNESIKIFITSCNFSLFYNSTKIALFLPFDGEINTYPLILNLWKNKKKVFLPVIHSFNKKKMLFVRFFSNSILYRNKYKILEPFFKSKDIIPICDLDVIIVPLVAFDKTGSRLGMGGGFYDSFLANWQTKNFIPMGFAYNFQLVDNLPKQYWDVSLPIVLTPNKIWIF